MIDKATLRRTMRQVCEVVADRELRSIDVWMQVAETEQYRVATTVMAFDAMVTEPATEGLFARIARDGKRLVLPRIEDDVLVAVAATGETTPGPFGIAEPVGPALPTSAIDLVLVPGLAFTLDGARLGRGKAYYDRFLKTIDCPTIGVCFTDQIVDQLPLEPHDVILDHVIHA